jgi:spore coat polysaccharide biosynthesis protein SpsF
MKNLGGIGVVIATRLSSSRLPGKALKEIQNIPMIVFLIRRLLNAKYVDEIILATSTKSEDKQLVELAASEGIKSFCGSLNDVVERYVKAAEKFELDTIIRVTGDCPFVDGVLVDYCLNKVNTEDFDICTTKGLFPVGLDVEIIKIKSLKALHKSEKLSAEDREHLTLYYYNNASDFKIVNINPPVSWRIKDMKYTVDTLDDYIMANNLANNFSSPYFSIDDLILAGKSCKN